MIRPRASATSGGSRAGAAGFAKSRRLRKRREFLAVQRGGRRLHSSDFLVITARSPAGETSEGRVGITVSKKVGNAVTRNRIKRLVREFVRRERFVPAGIDAVVIAKRGAASVTGYAQVAADLAPLARRMRTC